MIAIIVSVLASLFVTSFARCNDRCLLASRATDPNWSSFCQTSMETIITETIAPTITVPDTAKVTGTKEDTHIVSITDIQPIIATVSFTTTVSVTETIFITQTLEAHTPVPRSCDDNLQTAPNGKRFQTNFKQYPVGYVQRDVRRASFWDCLQTCSEDPDCVYFRYAFYDGVCALGKDAPLEWQCHDRWHGGVLRAPVCSRQAGEL